MYDASKDEEVLVTSQLALVEMDNMMAMEACHLKGPAAKQNCRVCIVSFRENFISLLKITKLKKPGNI